MKPGPKRTPWTLERKREYQRQWAREKYAREKRALVPLSWPVPRP